MQLQVLGQVGAVFVGAQPGGTVQRIPSVEAVAGSGLVGDRYFASDVDHDPREEITLFSDEDVRSARDESGIPIDHTDLRRNILTTGVDLPGLVGATIRVGEVVIDSLEDNPPCAHLQRLAGKQILAPLVGRGGLRGRIVTGGTIREGDPIERVPDGWD